jgi:hypothetical protein
MLESLSLLRHSDSGISLTIDRLQERESDGLRNSLRAMRFDFSWIASHEEAARLLL